MLSDFDVNNIQDAPAARDAIVMLLNMIENIKQENQELKEQNQCLKDEINRLKGEQGKPKVKPIYKFVQGPQNREGNTNSHQN